MCDHLKDWIIKHEGIKLYPYSCPAGKTTIGVGRNLTDVGLTTEEALYLLDNDIDRCRHSLLAYPWFTRQPEVIQNCLINMCFNLGIAGLLKFKNMIKALQEHDYEAAAHHALDSRWARQVPNRAKDVVKVMRSVC